jgi:hypothetical protein
MEQKLRIDQTLKPESVQVLQGRLAAAKWLSMSEPEVAREATDIEGDPLFRELVFGGGGRSPLVRRRRWPAAEMHQGFYELKEEIAAGDGSADIHDLIEKHEDLLGLIRKIGQDNFERYFLIGDTDASFPEICETLGIKEDVGRRIMDLVLEVGARSEFFRPGRAPETAGVRYSCIAEIERDPREAEGLFFRFFAPHWARGRYEIQYDRLEDWKKHRELNVGERRDLRKLLKRIEMLNMRQDTLFQILSRSSTEQSVFLRTRRRERLRPLSLRELARRIGVAPSTVSRAIARRSVVLPWGEEVPLKYLLTGQREVLLEILKEWRRTGIMRPGVTDESLMVRLAEEAGITVSRRTVNECRRKLLNLVEEEVG